MKLVEIGKTQIHDESLSWLGMEEQNKNTITM
jgi:hypothetical protein